MKDTPTQEYLLSLLDYAPETGELRWKERQDIADSTDCRQWNIKYAGKVAGCVNGRGYRVLTVNGITHYVHRLIWKLITGRDAVLLDHRNCIPGDNRLCNLREATCNQNAQNRKPVRNKKSGLPKGVVFNFDHKGGPSYQVSVRVAGSSNAYIGCYNTLGEARRSYRIHARRLFGEYARHS